MRGNDKGSRIIPGIAHLAARLLRHVEPFSVFA